MRSFIICTLLAELTGTRNSTKAEWVGHGRDKKCVQNFGNISEEHKPSGAHRWENNIKTDL
jgi:hypothetical protein